MIPTQLTIFPEETPTILKVQELAEVANLWQNIKQCQMKYLTLFIFF
jgi:hypothetical protein